MSPQKIAVMKTRDGKYVQRLELDNLKELISRVGTELFIKNSTLKLKSVFGLESVKDALMSPISWNATFPDFSKNPFKGHNKFLLFGAPGTGKSYLAEAVAGEAENWKFFSVSARDLISCYGENSKDLLKQLFDVARQKKPSIVFIDDLDALNATRNEDVDWDRKTLKSELCHQLESFRDSENTGMVIIAAARSPQNLDEKIIRRFGMCLYTPLPDLNARREMLISKLIKSDSSLILDDIDNLAKILDGYSGWEISTICMNAERRCISQLFQATYFRIVTVNQEEYFTPCKRSDNGALEMTLEDVPREKLLRNALNKEDAFSAVREARRGIDSSTIRKLENFARPRGQLETVVEADQKNQESIQEPKKQRSLFSRITSTLIFMLIDALD